MLLLYSSKITDTIIQETKVFLYYCLIVLLEVIMNFSKIVECFDCKLCENTDRFNPAGKLFYADSEAGYSGYYWFYEGEDFYIDIHDFFINKDYIVNRIPDMSDYISVFSNYLIEGSGEWLTPYNVLEPNTVFVMSTDNLNQRYILHANSKLLMIGLKFKQSMFDKYTPDFSKKEIMHIFEKTQPFISDKLSIIAGEILNCKMEEPCINLFFEAKAREWLSIIIDASDNLEESVISDSDLTAIQNVANYINDHYAFDISQEFLEKLSLMSGTKLKSTFKKKYHMSITEYTQRKRMNIAENLILTTDLEIKEIAKSVGYTSASRFSSLFFRYKKILPNNIRKYKI